MNNRIFEILLYFFYFKMQPNQRIIYIKKFWTRLLASNPLGLGMRSSMANNLYSDPPVAVHFDSSKFKVKFGAINLGLRWMDLAFFFYSWLFCVAGCQILKVT